MRSDYLEQINPFWGRLAGGVLLLFAAGTTLLVGRIVYVCAGRIANGWVPNTTDIVMFAFLLGVAAFCWYLGYRLVLHRASRSGMLFGSMGWTVLGMAFGAGTLLLAAMIFKTREWLQVRVLLGVIGLTAWCFYLAHRARDRRDSLFPVED